jgi:hypothetical protein
MKVLTIFLNLTKCLEANLREKLNTDEYRDVYRSLTNLLDKDKKYEILDESEETSYINEFKIYYLLGVLVYKNVKSRDYLLHNLNILDLIDKKAYEYLFLVVQLIELHKKKDRTLYSEDKVQAIGKNLTKYFEFVYHFMVGDGVDQSMIKKFKHNTESNFNKLHNLVDNNRTALEKKEEFDVFYWITRKYQECESYEIE